MNKLFTSSGFVESGLFVTADGSSIELESLPPVLRVLLTTDGTVTKSIESFFWEPVCVQNQGQNYIHLDEDAAIIERHKGDRVLRRKVHLVGENTGVQYVSATSLICTEYLPEKLRQELEDGQVGVGELLRECGLETYREIVDLGQSQDLTEDPKAKQLAVWRTYRIVMGHHPFIQITERFPLEVYR